MTAKNPLAELRRLNQERTRSQFCVISSHDGLYMAQPDKMLDSRGMPTAMATLVKADAEFTVSCMNLMDRLLAVVEASESILEFLSCTRFGHQDNVCPKCILDVQLASLTSESGD